jgi:hydroxymethylglutaryl-CoA lyase
LIDRLTATGLSVVEATSFVSPKAIPQLADGAEVLAGITQKSGVGYPVLVPNAKGMESALKCGVAEIAVFGAASEKFTQTNIKCSIAESLVRFETVMAMAKENDIKVRGYVSCVMGCPYENNVAAAKVQEVAQTLLDMGCYEISLGDTIGIGTPDLTYTLLEALHGIPRNLLAAHFHNTYDRAIPNLIVALNEGISVADSSVAGIGGCPYAKGASGNVATEDVVYLCELLGIEHGVDLKQLIEVGDFISTELNRENLSSVKLKDLEKLPQRREEIQKLFIEDGEVQEPGWHRK